MSMLAAFGATLLALALGGTAAAQTCPTAEALAGGLLVTRASGLTETWRAHPDDPALRLASEREADGAEVLRLELIHGLYVVSEAWLGMDWAPRVTRLDPPPPVPKAGAELTFAISTSGDGPTPETADMVARFGPLGTVTLAGCTLQAMRAEVEMPGYAERHLYLPQAGMSIYLYAREGTWQDADPVVAFGPAAE